MSAGREAGSKGCSRDHRRCEPPDLRRLGPEERWPSTRCRAGDPNRDRPTGSTILGRASGPHRSIRPDAGVERPVRRDLVGLTESEAREKELDLRVNTQDTSDWYSNRRVAETCAMFKVIVDNKADRVVGAHLLGPHADEVINLFALAIRSGVPSTDLKHLLYAYPTSGSDVPYMI